MVRRRRPTSMSCPVAGARVGRDTRRTVHALVASQGDPAELAAERAAHKRLADAEKALKRYQAAIAAGVEPSAVVDELRLDIGCPASSRAVRCRNCRPRTGCRVGSAVEFDARLASAAAHPTTVNLREDIITGAINGWVGELFAPENRDETVRALVASPGDPAELAADRGAHKRLADAETALKRYQAAIAAGVEPSAVVDAINQARAERDAARAHLAQAPDQPPVMDLAEVYAMIDALGDVGSVIERAQPEGLARLYRELDLDVRYLPAHQGGVATLSLRVASECVRGGT